MPSQAPPIDATTSATLKALGQDIGARRRALSISTVVAAQAASMSRVTLHRIEHGEPSVTMGAYLNAMAALGLTMSVKDAIKNPVSMVAVEASATSLPAVRLADHPQLQQLAWHLPAASVLTPAEALGIFERHWRHLDFDAMDSKERALLDMLVGTLGKGHLLV